MKPEEYYLYGTDRLGSVAHYKTDKKQGSKVTYKNIAGRKRYELSDHLGNVSTVISDRKPAKNDQLWADVWEKTDYYPFGQMIDERSRNYAAPQPDSVPVIDTLDIITWDATQVITPRYGKFTTPLDDNNEEWTAYAWTTSTAQNLSNADFTSSVEQSAGSPIFEYTNGNNTDTIMHLKGLGHKTYRIGYNINPTTVPGLKAGVGQKVRFSFYVRFDGSFQNPRVAVEALPSQTVIESESFTSLGNMQLVGKTLEFPVTSLDMQVAVSCNFANTTSYDPGAGYSGTTNAIQLRTVYVKLLDPDTTKKQVVDSAGFWERPGYLFAFNGMERDDEVYGNGSAYTATFWEYDPRLGRRWNIDPVVKPWESPYATFNGNPILRIDPLGNNAGWFVNEKTGDVLHAPGEDDISNVDVENKEDYAHFATDKEMTEASFDKAPSAEAEYSTKTWSAEDANNQFSKWGVDRQYSVNSISVLEIQTIETVDFEIGGSIKTESTLRSKLITQTYAVTSPGMRISFNEKYTPRLIKSTSSSTGLYPKLNTYREDVMTKAGLPAKSSLESNISSNSLENIITELGTELFKRMK